jgi:DNA-directed RNA polymerase specialized sigma24 family protein
MPPPPNRCSSAISGRWCDWLARGCRANRAACGTRRADQGKFPKLTGRDNLWPLLVVITSCKAADELQRARRIRRGRGEVRGESAFGDDKSTAGERGIEQVADTGPTRQFAVLMADVFERLLARLSDDALRAVALWKMDGYSNDEIAAKLGRDLRTVERKLKVIRSLWQEYRDEQGNGNQ